MSRSKKEVYIPAAGIPAFTPLYDLAVRLGLRERRMREWLIEDAALEPGMRVVDLACGTGTLTVLIKRRAPDCDVVGVDIDAEVLAIAQRKAEHAKVAVRFARQAVTDSLSSFGPLDRVFSSLVMHHLDARTRVTALARVRDALATGGRVHVVDFGRPSSLIMRAAFVSIQLLDGFATTRDALASSVTAHLAEAGFVDVREHRQLDTAFGTLRFWSGRR